MLKKGMLGAAFALLVAGAGAFAQKQQVMLDKVVAVVGSSSILHSEVAEYARQLTAQRRAEGYTSDRDPMNEALEALMTQKLLFNQAQIDSVKINAGDIATHVEQQIQNMIETEGSIPKLEAKHHMAIFSIRENMRQRYEEQSYASSMQSEVVSKVSVIPGEVERFYKSIDKDSLPTVAEQYVYAQITRFPKSITEAKQRTRERLLDMRERIITGKAKFENLARMYSQDPGTMMRGGEMDPTELNGLEAPFADALENMKPGRYRRSSRPATDSISSSCSTSAAASTISAISCCARSIRWTSSTKGSCSWTASPTRYARIPSRSTRPPSSSPTTPRRR